MKVTKQQVWAWFSIYIRLKYMDEKCQGFDTCYTCGKELPIKEMEAGHAISGRTAAVLFDEEIVRPQCARCNKWLNGNYGVFSSKLIEEHGKEWWDNKWREAHKPKQWRELDLEALYNYYKSEVDRMLLRVKNPDNLPIRWQKHLKTLKKGGKKCSG